MNRIINDSVHTTIQSKTTIIHAMNLFEFSNVRVTRMITHSKCNSNQHERKCSNIAKSAAKQHGPRMKTYFSLRLYHRD